MNELNDEMNPVDEGVGAEHEDGQAPLHAILGGEDGADAGGTGKRGVSSGTLVMGGVVVAAVAGLFSMRTLSRVTAGDDIAPDIEQKIDTFINASGSVGGDNSLSHDALAALDNDYTELQVPLVNVQRNPFVIFQQVAMQDMPDVDPADQAAMAAAQEAARLAALRDKRRDEITRASERLTLKSVILGKAPLANVDGSIVRRGDTIEIADLKVAFTVTDISRTAVTLEARDDQLNLVVEVSISIDQTG